MAMENLVLWLAAINPESVAPTKVPRACAKNGIKKLIGLNKCIDAFNPSVVIKSAPIGGGIIASLIITIPIFAMLPKITPTATAKRLSKIVFIMYLIIR
jgi:hypothetical protein